MSRRAKNGRQIEKTIKPAARVSHRRSDSAGADGLPANYWKACELVRDGQYQKARGIYARLERSGAKADARLRVLIQNDLGVLAAMEGRFDEACQGWRMAIECNSECLPARLNLGLVEAELSLSAPGMSPVDANTGVAPVAIEGGPTGVPAPRSSPDRIRVAILSFLFNLPSTGGGNMHTAGMARFLARAGYDVRHFYARYPAWGIGRVDGDGYLRGGDLETFGRADGGVGDPRRTGENGGGVGDPRRTGGRTAEDDSVVGDPHRTPGSEAIEFTDSDWNAAGIQARYRRAVDQFQPDYVVITDSWNMKPLLAEAMRDYPCLLLFQAHECLCPLNNLRLLADGLDQVRQCPRNQLATPDVCHRCLADRGHQSGALHQYERALAGVGTQEYDQKLRRSLQDAEAVLAMNPLIAGMLEPYAKRVCVVPLGIDSARFPWPVDDPDLEPQLGRNHRARGANPGDENADETDLEPQPGRNHTARDVNPGMTTDHAILPHCSEPRGGDMTHPGTGTDVAPSGLGGKEESDAAHESPGLTPRALRSRPSGASRRLSAVASADSEGEVEQSPGLTPRALRSRPSGASRRRSAIPLVATESDVEDTGRAIGTQIKTTGPLTTLFMAAVANEFIKGFHVAHEACRLLRQSRSDFELVITFDPPGPIDEFTRSVGWCSQAELPRQYQAADICLVPTIAQDGMSLTSVEAMAASIPVVASRIGGLPYTVTDGVTGLLSEPGNPADLAEKIARLLDDPPPRRQMGLASRQRFEQDFTWEVVIERYWRPLLALRASRQ